MTYLAHSAKKERGIPEQEYREHIENVVRDGVLKADDAAKHSTRFGDLLRASVRQAAEFHDLGKLDEINQEVFRTNRGRTLRHIDAGVAHILAGPPNSVRTAAALAVFAHHNPGLPTIADECTKQKGRIFRDESLAPDGTPLRAFTDRRLTEYQDRHLTCTVGLPTAESVEINLPAPPLLLRLALSCLVDADHTDTARHYGDPVADRLVPPLAALERLAILDQYVAELGRYRNDKRFRLRSQVYRQCRDSDCSAGFVACDSPVGSGKTTAVMAHMLKAAAAKGLRRVYVVLPFTNIIDQSVDVYRKALVRTEEAANEVVVAHHHRAEFEKAAARQYSFLWHAPVVVTTAVQFFETFAARCPAALRKLHQVPGSAIFIDEAHAALPVHLWPQAWLWLRELERDWNCHVVLGSGSLQRFWEYEDFVKPPAEIPQIIPSEVRASSADHERCRVKYRSRPEPLDLDGLATFVASVEGPRLLIVNTVQSAAAIARYLEKRFGGEHVEHLSTALTPADRKATMELVKLRLRQPNHRDWTLVATSCVEAGVDFSFRTGIRERCNLTSLLQIAGRVNRENEYGGADVWDIRLRHDSLLRPHRAFDASARVLAELFNEGKVSPEFCSEALRREIRQEGMPRKNEEILKAERNADFPEVEKLFRVITSDTLTAVVDDDLISRLKSRMKVTPEELQAGSVQIWTDRRQDWGVAELEFIPGLWKWTLDYDSFLGYMAGVLSRFDHVESGFIA